MHTIYHIKSAAELSNDILESIRVAFRDRSIVITVEDEQDGEDDWAQLTDGQRASVMRGVKDMEDGNTVSHAEMLKYYDKWLTK